jgi:hypothetical protein
LLAVVGVVGLDSFLDQVHTLRRQLLHRQVAYFTQGLVGVLRFLRTHQLPRCSVTDPSQPQLSQDSWIAFDSVFVDEAKTSFEAKETARMFVADLGSIG